MNLLDALTKWANAWYKNEDNSNPYPQDVRDELQYRLLIQRSHIEPLVINLPAGSAYLIQDAILWIEYTYSQLDTKTLQYGLDSNGEVINITTLPNLVLYWLLWRLEFCFGDNEQCAAYMGDTYDKASDFYFVVWSAITNQLKAIELS